MVDGTRLTHMQDSACMIRHASCIYVYTMHHIPHGALRGMPDVSSRCMLHDASYKYVMLDDSCVTHHAICTMRRF